MTRRIVSHCVVALALLVPIAVAASGPQTATPVPTRPDLVGKWVLVPDTEPNELVVLNPGQREGTVKGPARVPSLGEEFVLSITGNVVTIERQFQHKPLLVSFDLAGPATPNILLGYKELWSGHWESSKLVIVTRAEDVPENAAAGVLKRTMWLAEDGALKIETAGLTNRPVQITTYTRPKVATR